MRLRGFKSFFGLLFLLAAFVTGPAARRASAGVMYTYTGNLCMANCQIGPNLAIRHTRVSSRVPMIVNRSTTLRLRNVYPGSRTTKCFVNSKPDAAICRAPDLFSAGCENFDHSASSGKLACSVGDSPTGVTVRAP